jgi:KaiC/GvpD/RAD55 family RecA-like ATPase
VTPPRDFNEKGVCDVKNPKEKTARVRDLGKDFTGAVEKFVMEKLGDVESAFLLGNKLYKKPKTEPSETRLRGVILPRIETRLALEKSDFELGETMRITIELQNTSQTAVWVTRIENLVPRGFELVDSGGHRYVNTYLDVHGKKVDPYIAETIEITLRSTKKGSFLVAPKVFYKTEAGVQTSSTLEPVSIMVSETILPDRIQTGFQDLDNLLLGGIPKGYAVILTSSSCDERDLLIKRYMQSGAADGTVTLCVTTDASSARNLVEQFPTSFYVLVCNPHVDETLKTLPNVLKVAGVENLTEISISLESILRRLEKAKNIQGRVCLEIVSDVLLQHQAVQTRKWLSGLIPLLKSRGFTTLAVMNPYMHRSEELHAVLDLFDGEISIYEKDDAGETKLMRVRKMYDKRYLESELPLKKTRLMTMPLTLSCCSRAPAL